MTHDREDVGSVGESANQYWARKHEELALLAGAAGEPAPSMTMTAMAGSGLELWRHKQRLRAALLARAALGDPGLTESNLHGGLRGRFQYTYQRFDLHARTRRFFQQVYALDAHGGISLGVWGGSGMGIITAALRALDGWLKAPCRLLHPVDAYFETRKVLPRLAQFLPNVDDDDFRFGDVFYLDSVSEQDRFFLLERGPLHMLQLVIFDTTCYDAGSAKIDRVVERCAQARVPLLLLRSHLKLDNLATEYARLGSAVLWLPSRPSKFHIKMAGAMRRSMIDELSLSGAMPTPASFWPLAGDEKFCALNAQRNARMVEAQSRAAAGLRQNAARLQVGEPHHGCFLVLTRERTSGFVFHRDAKNLLARLNAAGILARLAPSFGYDLVGVNVLTLAGGRALRLALPDLPDDEIDRVVQVVAENF